MSAYKNEDDCPYRLYYKCAYPNCKNNGAKIDKDKPFVIWDSMGVEKEQVWDGLSPIARLSETSNLSEFVEKYGYYPLNLELHPGCAAEWGMQLIKDAINADANVARSLRTE
jgi:hypothetical protein